MTALTGKPSFRHAQRVGFIGGEGIVLSCQFEAGAWIYFVEMPQGLEPNFGRVGAETIVLFAEAELWVHDPELKYSFLTSPED